MRSQLAQAQTISEVATVLYSFLPGSGNPRWRNHVTFASVADQAGVGHFWPGGSKTRAIETLLECTLDQAPHRFEQLISLIVRAGVRYRRKRNKPVQRTEMELLIGLLSKLGHCPTALRDVEFLDSLDADASDLAAKVGRHQVEVQRSDPAGRRKLDVLKAEFYSLVAQTDRQAAGLALEGLLNRLFALDGLTPRQPFRVTGEQIDGSFVLDRETYLLEAKWEKKKLSEQPLMVFREKISGKSAFTRGLFLAVNGCTGPALDAITRGKQPNFFIMDGADLVRVLEGQYTLPELMRVKVRRLAEDGRVFIPVSELS